jgi:hypothetical protein
MLIFLKVKKLVNVNISRLLLLIFSVTGLTFLGDFFTNKTFIYFIILYTSTCPLQSHKNKLTYNNNHIKCQKVAILDKRGASKGYHYISTHVRQIRYSGLHYMGSQIMLSID